MDDINILEERLANMDTNTKEAFDRVYSRLGSIEKQETTFIAKPTVQWFIGVLVTILITLVVYMSNSSTLISHELHELDKYVAERITSQDELNTASDRRIYNLEKFVGIHTRH